ncbi:hypothetical protein PGH07_00880 [Sulfurovum sp. zt1-1]|uniref:Uncharacterized protein n=1 Tax=Sulfurovum zhangzhouensis TaxID=3019067 RepID=A0ABT7QV67_9BACT|nr:hypothetical protein [Sulfurovum zhangzhouensis]MDM5270728.1 hypothetical protein [Sulfurovum zhangzhouensis]
MEKLTLKAYAKRHKISIFNVMKMVREGSVQSETVLEDGKEAVYIVENKEQGKEIQSKITKYTQTPLSLEKEVELLKNEMAELRNELEALKKKL